MSECAYCRESVTGCPEHDPRVKRAAPIVRPDVVKAIGRELLGDTS